MITHTFTNVRLDVNTPWYELSQEVIDRRQSAYIDTGKIVSRSVVESSDGLIRTIETVFSTTENLTEFLQDPVIKTMIEARNQYNKLHNITARGQRKET